MAGLRLSCFWGNRLVHTREIGSTDQDGEKSGCRWRVGHRSRGPRNV